MSAPRARTMQVKVQCDQKKKKSAANSKALCVCMLCTLVYPRVCRSYGVSDSAQNAHLLFFKIHTENGLRDLPHPGLAAATVNLL